MSASAGFRTGPKVHVRTIAGVSKLDMQGAEGGLAWAYVVRRASGRQEEKILNLSRDKKRRQASQ